MIYYSSQLFLLITIFLSITSHHPTTSDQYEIIICEPDFTFETNPCSQEVAFQAIAPSPVSNPNLTFEWDFGDGTSPGFGTIINHNFNVILAGTTTFSVTLTVTDASIGCTNSIVKMITIDALPDAQLEDDDIFSPFAHCDGDMHTLVVNNTSSTIDENASYEIDWGDGSPPFIGDNNFTTTSHDYSGQGAYSIVMIVTGLNGCTSTFFQEFYMGGNPAVGISLPSLGNVCSNTVVSVEIENWENNSDGTNYIITSNSNPNPLFTFVHPPPSVVEISFDSSSCGFTSLGEFPDAFHVTVEAINPCGNAAATAQPIRVSSPPTAAIETTPPQNACPGQTFDFCDVSFGANYYIASQEACTEAINRMWEITPNTYSLIGSTLEDSCLTVGFNQPGTYEACLTVDNPCGISTICETVVIAETPIANASANFSGDGCAPQIIQFENLSQNQTSSTWMIIPATGWTGNINDQNPEITFNEFGNYTVQLTITNPCGTDFWETTIEINDTPTGEIMLPASICVGDAIQPITNIQENGCTIDSFTWSFPEGNPSSSSDSNPTIIYNNAGEFPITLEITNCCGTTTIESSIIVTGITSANASILLSNNNGCAPETINLTDLSQNNTSSEWNIDPPNGWMGNLNLPNPEIIINNSGTYTFSLLAEGGCGEASWDTTLIFQSAPTVSIEVENSICVGGTIQPTANIQENGCAIDSLIWFFPGGNPSTSNSPTPSPITFFTADSVEISVTVFNCCGSTTSTAWIEVEDFVSISVPEQIELCLNDPCITLSGTPSTNCNWTQNGMPVSTEFCPNLVGTFEFVYVCGSADCPSFDTTTIIVNDLPPITSMPSDSILCENDPPVTLIAIPNNENTWWTGNGIDSSGVLTPNLAGMGGEMVYHHLDTVTGCLNTDVVNVTINQTSDLNISDESFCNISSINLEDEFGIVEGPGESVTWSGIGIINSQEGIFELPPNVVVLPADFIITYTFSNSFDCVFSDSISITINPLIPADAGLDTILCAEGTYQLSGNFDLNIGTWTGGVNSPSITSDGIIDLEDSIIPIGQSQYTYTYTAFAGTTCEVSDVVEVTIINLANSDAGQDQYFCVTESIATLSSGTNPSDVIGIWSGVPVIDSVLGIVDISLIPVDSFTSVTYTITSSNLSTCNSTDEVLLYSYSPPIIDFEYSSPPCVGLPISFNNQTTGATQYFWSFGDGDTSSEINPNHTYTSSGDFMITLEAWSVDPIEGEVVCLSVDSQMIIIPPIPEIDLSINTFNGCESTTVYFGGTTISGGGDYELIVGNDSFINEIPDSVIILAEPDTFDISISISVTDDCYPVSTDTIIEIPAAFDANFALTDFNQQSFIFCPPYEANFINLSTGAIDSFLVNYGNGLTSTDEFVTQIYDNLTDSLLTYEIQLIIFNSLCPPDTATLELTIKPYTFESELQTFQVSACEGTPTLFIAQVSPWVDTIIFNPGNGLGTFSIMAGDTVSYIYPQSGNYIPILSATDGCGIIIDSSEISILSAPNLELIVDSETCVGEGIFATIVSDNPIVNPQIIFPDIVINDVLGEYIPLVGGSILVEAIALDSITLCPSEVTSVIQVNEYLGPLMEVGSEEICDEVILTLENPIDLIIIDNDRIIEPMENDTTVNILFQEPGIHFIELIKYDDQGCELKQTISVESVENTITVDAGRDTIINLGETVILEGIVENGIPPFNITWSGNPFIESNNDLTTLVNSINSGFYTLNVKDNLGCENIDSMYLTVIDTGGVFVPNIFSPNGDGVNDRFYIFANPEIKEVSEFRIFDRWGEEVFGNYNFIPNDPGQGWDGNLKGKKMNPGVFVWFAIIVSINGEEKTYQGDVTLMK